MDLVCFGQQNWDVCWTAKQQLLTRLARRGHRVLYVDPLPRESPSRLSTIHQWAFPDVGRCGLRQLEDGLWAYAHSSVPALGRVANARARRVALGRVARRLGMRAPVALVLSPQARWLVDGVGPAARVYYAVDEWTAFGGLERHREWLRSEEEALLRLADVALAVSPRLLERFAQVQPRSYLLQNAADLQHFSPAHLAASPPHPAVAALPRPRIGFVGQVDERIDQDLVAHLSARRPHWQIVLAGRLKDEVDFAPIRGRPNVHLLGYQPYASLPGVLREVDVCVVPYRLTSLTQSCNPLKVYEYLATGLPVVSTPLEGLNACRDAVVTAAGPEAFLAAVDAALADPEAGRAARLAVAAANGWEGRADELEDRLEEALRVASERAGAAAARRTLSARGANRRGVRLDAKDESERQLRKPFRQAPLPPARRALFELTRAVGWVYYAGRVAGRIMRGRRPFAVRRILVARHACLGDLLVFLPTLAALRRKYPHAKIALGVQPGMSAGDLLAGSRDVDEIRVIDFMSRPSRAQRYRGAWDLFREGYDLMVFGVGYFLIRDAWFCGAPVRVGLYDGHPLQRFGTRLLPADPNRHEADNSLALAEAIGCRATTAERVPTVTVDRDAMAAAAVELSLRLQLPGQVPVVTVHPGSKRPSRRWPAERFAALIERLLDDRPDFHVVLTGVADEAALVEEIMDAVSPRHRRRVHLAAGATTLPSLVALLDRSAAVVCNDTGVMHLARARGRPLLALLGPENDRRWGPYPLGTAPAEALRHRVPCAPCVRWDCESHYCMRSLSVDEASAALGRLLSGPPSEGSSGPAGAAEPDLLPLRRTVRHREWDDLAAAGHELPLVTVVVLPGDGSGGAGAVGEVAGDSRPPVPQDYPNAEWLYPPPGMAGRPIEWWQAALSAAQGQFVVVWCRGQDWRRRKLGEEVAALVRTPDVAAAADGRVFDRAAVAAMPEWARGAPPAPGIVLRTPVARDLLMRSGTAASGVVPVRFPTGAGNHRYAADPSPARPAGKEAGHTGAAGCGAGTALDTEGGR